MLREYSYHSYRVSQHIPRFTASQISSIRSFIRSRFISPCSTHRAYGDNPSTDTLAADGDNTNCSGLVPRLLVDLQKFMACGKVSIDDQSMPDQGLLSDPAKVNELKMVVTLPASARVNLLFRAPGAIRTAECPVMIMYKF